LIFETRVKSTLDSCYVFKPSMGYQMKCFTPTAETHGFSLVPTFFGRDCGRDYGRDDVLHRRNRE